ncbi:Predicted membrane protein [Robiginitalea myxolifaciens]|uniref:Predicted membrane protein n=1 Tax=Robiginitalea myxolifaciens TaxID=400055 RepID=A0A1I6HCM4_9FLAO|nr:DUF2306 domain-containing protein [Robiginitalea myxolifaciens]SFR52047.1 Predicted membrane protein [Robiginitalea myxolifaciens]
MPHDFTGWIHTLAALVALVSGSLILAKTKGTRWHRRTGRVYGIAMLTVCATSFMIYRLHNSFGILHFFALVSTITLILGMLPLYRKGVKNAIVRHLAWMYWSVIGLYSAFIAEILTRVPRLVGIDTNFGMFYGIVGLSAGLVGFIGAYYFKRKIGNWEEAYGWVK